MYVEEGGYNKVFQFVSGIKKQKEKEIKTSWLSGTGHILEQGGLELVKRGKMKAQPQTTQAAQVFSAKGVLDTLTTISVWITGLEKVH